MGCGWGGLADQAARHFGCQVVGATVSKEQAARARERCAGLPVAVELADWRSLRGRWDKIVSVGMFEHVGPKNDAGHFRRMRELLADEGLFLLHTIAPALRWLNARRRTRRQNSGTETTGGLHHVRKDPRPAGRQPDRPSRL